MTLDQLLGLNSATLDKWTPQDIERYFSPYLNITRPDRPSAKLEGDYKGGGSSSSKPNASLELAKKLSTLQPQQLLALKLASQASGIDISKLLKGKK